MDSLIKDLQQLIVGYPTETTIVFFIIVAVFSVLRRSGKTRSGMQKLQKAIKTQTNEPTTLHPEVDPAKCSGCGACTIVCPEGDILQLVNHKAVLVAPSKCVGHGECESACPTGAISLVFGTKLKGMEIPRTSGEYETNVPGLYIAGELGGMGLIRNAVKQGCMAAENAIKRMASVKDISTDTDLLIVGAGPAGLSAALTAIERKIRYLCIEQGSFGGTVYNFPRQKVVMSHPADLPLVGKMKFPQNKVSKEELLSFWNDVKTKTGLRVQEGTAFESLDVKNKIFEVKTSRGLIRAKKVILCLGVRGSPRKLGLKNEDLPKVAYGLIDPEQYQNMHIAVVGGGNAGVEAAQMLAKKNFRNKVTLLVRGTAFDRCNEENQKIIFDLQKQGLVEICFESSVEEIGKDQITIQKNGAATPIKNDFLFVFAGAEMPFKFLMSLGIQIDKKFGEKRQA